MAVQRLAVRRGKHEAVHLNVLKYGCQTKPIPGGLLGGVWTTITAVTSYDRWTCTVYVNGKLHDWSYIANVFYTSEMGTALTVGKGFHWSIDSVQMFNMSLDAAEVQSAYEGAVKRTNKKRMWLVDEQWWTATTRRAPACGGLWQG